MKSVLKVKAKKFSVGDGALVVFPPKLIREKIDKWRRLFDPGYRIIPPHITVSFPFLNEKIWRKNRSAITSEIAKFVPFKVSLRQTHYFKEKEHVLWLKPEDEGNLTFIHESLKRDFPGFISSFGFSYVPHLSIGFFESVRTLRSAWHIVSDGWKPVAFKVDRIYYVVHNERGRWDINSTLPLKKRIG